ncbi:MAG: EAL domain-containing protein [Oscillospiraceae bacterium]|nr:EAL domain-containing protein [Oscillospiraceae bacterium]
MHNSNDLFRSANTKRLILIADDERINREILGEILKSEYDLLFAADGEETLEKIRQHKDTLSLVLLDVLMPVMSGLEVLKAMKADESLSRIPVVVTTSEKNTEVESLRLGAIDFIPKPYPAVDVIHARIFRTIELSEDRETIQSTEHDPLTGLYNKEYFYRYAEQFDQHHSETEMDAVIADVSHFHLINERYGKAFGDEVLRRIGEALQEMAGSSGGIACRREADTFMLYCPHREDYETVLADASARLNDEASSGNRIRLRMGVYSRVDKSIDLERRFDRAKLAADTVRDTFTKTIGVYDDSLHKRQLYAEQLIEDFPTAIRERQFTVFYQPKFDVRPDTPLLTSAEALVRWNHPTLGMISPGVFIPLFEENGLIQKLDLYVWQETARQIRDWKDRLQYSIPVSVNVSRIDMYDPDIARTLQTIIRDQGLTGKDLLLEVTESAYTQDSTQIIEAAEKLRELGFQIELDDFGTGYSSLNMISSLPIDALKLDMQFTRNAFKAGGNTHMLEVIIGIADYLSVPVIAEGVETADQLRALKALGCDIVQGYFFSKPVPAADFEPFILQKKEADAVAASEKAKKELTEGEELVRQEKLELLRSQTEPSAEENAEEELPAEADTEQSGVQLKTASIFFVVLAAIAAAALLISNIAVTRGYKRMEAASDRYITAQLAASDMESGSDYLTDRVRCFVVTGELDYLKDFTEEVEVTRRRDKAVENLEALLGENESSAIGNLNTALALSNELVGRENRAMRLILETGNYDTSEVPDEIAGIELTPAEQAMTVEQLKETAQMLVFDNNYMHYKDRIRENVGLCTQALIRSASQELEQASARLALLVNLQTLMTILFLLIVLAVVAVITQMIRKPLTNMVHKMQAQEIIPPTGVEELRIVTRIYNQILKENREIRERLSREASHDALTGLFNRGAYDLLMESADTKHMALLLIDVDYFKSVNDTYGHAVGDRVLKKVAELLKTSFRSVDILCRIGGDEFAVVMTRVDSSLSGLVFSKIARMNEILQHPKDDLPPVSLSVGVAFSDRENPQGDIFRDADSALYRVKDAGRKGCAVYGGELQKQGGRRDV